MLKELLKEELLILGRCHLVLMHQRSSLQSPQNGRKKLHSSREKRALTPRMRDGLAKQALLQKL